MVTRMIPPNSGFQMFDNCSVIQDPVIPQQGEVKILANAVARLDPNCPASVVLAGTVYLIPGANATGIIVRARRGFGVTGPIDWEPIGYGPGGIGVTPGKVNAVPVNGILGADWYQQAQGGQYTITVEQVNATAPGQTLNASIAWFALQVWDVE